MPFADLMFVGLKLMLLGMGIVFTLLVVLVFALKGMSKLANWLAPVSTATVGAGAEVGIGVRAEVGTNQTRPAVENNEELVAVISAAVTKFRATHLKR